VSEEKLVVCLGFPVFHIDRFRERIEALPGVEAVVLPVDEGGAWAAVSPSDPHPEPPEWAVGVAAERREALARAQVLVTLHTPEDLLEKAPNLRWVQCIGAGVEQFPKAGATPDRVVLTNASGVSAPSMAEWVVGRLLMVWKRFREADEYQHRHEFIRTYGTTFEGATIGIVGLGSIGVAVSQRVRAFGCRVLATKRSARPGDTSEHADALYSTEQLHEMLGECDAVVVAAPATAETRHLIDAKALAAMKPNAVLVNVARGTLVDEAALADAMHEKRIAAAVLDVFDPEPLSPESPLWDLPGVYISAHSSVSTDRYMDGVFELFFDNVERWLRGDPLRNVVESDRLGLG
jgi:phosphoglycerate dehydrogenase-like enzyme